MSAQLHYGTFDSTLDEKGRVVVPAGLRDWYQGELWMTMGMQSCVWVMKPDQWKQLQRDIDNGAASLSEEDYENLLYKYIYPGRQAEIDQKSGRIPVQGPLRAYAGLAKDCLVISARNHLEIWDRDTFYDYLDAKSASIQAATNRLNMKFFSLKQEQGT